MKQLRAILPVAVAAALALGLALRALDPAWRDPSAWLVGNWLHPDCLSNHWLLAWVAEQVASGQSVLHNDRYYWPVGDAPVLAGNGGEGFLYLPFHLIWDWPTAVLPYALLVLCLNGLGGYALARAAGAKPWAALVAVGVTGLSPFVLVEVSSGRFSQSSICWLLFFLASWLRLLERPSAARAVLSGLLLAATSFFYWYYGLFGVIAGAVLLAGAALGGARPPLRALLIFSASFLVSIGPWAVIFLRYWSQIPGTTEADLFPHPEALHQATWPVLPFLVRDGARMGHAMAAGPWFLGLAGVGLALWPRRSDGAPAPWRGATARALVAVWLLFWALSLGPLGTLSPYNLIYGLADPLRRFWWPVRHTVVAQAAWATLAALALSALPGRWARLAPVLALGLVLASPWSLSRQGARTDVTITELKLPPPVYPALAELPGAVLLELPLSAAASGTQQQLIYQRYHRKILLGGHAQWVDRVRPPAWDAFVAANSFLSALQRYERGESGEEFAFDSADLEALRARGVAWVSLNRELFPLSLRPLVDGYRALFTALFGDPTLRDPAMQVFDTSKWTGQSRLEVSDFRWPDGLVPGGPSQPVNGKRPRSPVFGKGRGGRPLPGGI